MRFGRSLYGALAINRERSISILDAGCELELGTRVGVTDDVLANAIEYRSGGHRVAAHLYRPLDRDVVEQTPAIVIPGPTIERQRGDFATLRRAVR